MLPLPQDWDHSRISHHEVPTALDEMDATAGYNANVGSYWFVVRWTKDVGHIVKANDVYLDGGYPFELIYDIADLASEMVDVLDWESPHLVKVFANLLADKTVDASSQRYARNPNGYRHIPDLIGKVLDLDLTPVVPPRGTPGAPSSSPRRSGFDPRHHRRSSSA